MSRSHAGVTLDAWQRTHWFHIWIIKPDGVPYRMRRTTSRMLTLALLGFLLVLARGSASACGEVVVGGWKMQDAARISETASTLSSRLYKPQGWYAAIVPGTVLTTMVSNGVYPEPLYGENMRGIPESLNQHDYWYRATVIVPRLGVGRHCWLHFGGINYSADVWVNGHEVGTMRGAFIRGDFDITKAVSSGARATIAVLVHPQPHAGVPHEHTIANGVGSNGGETAADGPTFLATIGWDWLPAVRDRNTGIWLPVTMDDKGPVIISDTFVSSVLDDSFKTADITIKTKLSNGGEPVIGTLVGALVGEEKTDVFRLPVTLGAGEEKEVELTSKVIAALHLGSPHLWWPNGYGRHPLYQLKLRFESGNRVSDRNVTSFGIRRISYELPGKDFLTISVNGVPIMIRGGNWGMDEGLKRNSRERLDAEFHMHAIANMNMIRNWVGQSTSPDFYDMADKYGMLLWDEFFQPNPNDGPDVIDLSTYLANVEDKILRYRNHPSIAVWCARNEGYPPKALDEKLRALMQRIDPVRLYQSNSADGRGVSSHGPYSWREPAEFYKITEAFKTETGSMSIPTIESIQGMMPQKDWDSINDDWAQHDFAKGAAHGDEYLNKLSTRYGAVRNLADFVRKAQLANYEAFRAMYEGRNAKMFQQTSGVITWMSNPAQPSFVWQIYHHDLDPNASMYAVQVAAESFHVQWNESTNDIEVVNNLPASREDLTVRIEIMPLLGKDSTVQTIHIGRMLGSSVKIVGHNEMLEQGPVRIVQLKLLDAKRNELSSNTYWRSETKDGLAALQTIPNVPLDVTASRQKSGVVRIVLRNNAGQAALMTHLQFRRADGRRILPTYFTKNYIILMPGEKRTVFAMVDGSAGVRHGDYLSLDGFNVSLGRCGGTVHVRLNRNALPEFWPSRSDWGTNNMKRESAQ